MPTGVEVRNDSIRISFNYKGKRCRPTLKGLSPSPKNIKFAEQKRSTVLYEINAGKFDYSKHFPNCPKADLFSPGALKATTVREAVERWLMRKKHTVARSTYRNYKSKAENHVVQRWGERKISEIGKLEIEEWMDVELHHLSNKTINDILTILRGALTDYKDDNPTYINPLERISNKPLSPQDIDPFTRDEIEKITQTETNRLSERNMIEFAIWTGLSLSEVIALAWEDVDLEAEEVMVNRARVEGEWKSTKEKQRRRSIELISKAKNVLIHQKELTGSIATLDIDVKQSDNKSFRKETITPVFVVTSTQHPFKDDFKVRDRFFRTHLKKAGVPFRGPNNCRHTYASQMLTMGLPKMWVAEQLGHTDTKMIDKHYGKWIKEDAPRMADMASRLIEETDRAREAWSHDGPID